MNAWWDMPLGLVGIVLILSSRLVLRCVEGEIQNINQTASAVLHYLQCLYVQLAYEASLMVYQG